MRFLKFLGTILPFFVVHTSLLAQPAVLTLDEARQLSLEKNINVIQAQNNVESAQGQALAARGRWLPSLSASAGWARNQNDITGGVRVVEGIQVDVPDQFDVFNNYSAGLSLGYTIFDGFSRSSNVAAATSQAVSSEMTSSRARQSAVFQVESGYLNVLRNERLVTVSEENLKRDQRQLERIMESNRVGALSIADVYRQQSQVAQDELELIRAKNMYETSKLDVVALIGLDVNQEYIFTTEGINVGVDSLEMAETVSKYRDLRELSSRAMVARPDYRGAQEDVYASDEGVTAARSGYWPTLGAFLSGSMSNPELGSLSDNTNLRWGINFRWDLFDQFRTNEGIQNAVARQRNAEIALVQAERDIGVEVKKAMLDLEASAKSVEASRKALVAAQEDYKIAEERYNLGAGTLLDLLVANASLVNAQVILVNSVTTYIFSTFNVEYALGERTY
jgi:outer membrane protein